MATATKKNSKIVEVEHDGQTYTFRAIDRMLEDQIAAFAAVRAAESYDVVLLSYEFMRVMGNDTEGLDMQDVTEILDAWADAGETSTGESSGSETSSEPVAKKSSTSSSKRG